MKTIISILFVLNVMTGFAQFEYFTVDSERFTFIPLEGLGESIGKPNETIAFGYNTMGDSCIVAILGDSKEALVIGYTSNEWFNYAKMNDPYWRNDTIFIGSEMPYRATQNTFEFVWNNEVEGFFATEGDSYDPSWEAVEKADSCLAAGDLYGAVQSYYMVMYPQTYMNESEVGIKLMELAHKKALIFFKENQYDTAVALMNFAMDFYPNSNYISFESKSAYDEIISEEGGWYQTWTPDQIKLWLGDYGLFLYKAKKYKESITFHSYLNMILPDLAGPYLQLGDSYYDSGDKTNAKTAYKKYTELKKTQGKEKEIPKRVKERSK